MSELKFTRVNNEEYNTVSINIENAIIDIKEEDFQVINREKTKFGYIKSTIKIINEDIKDKLKTWETEINEYLKNEVGTGPITIFIQWLGLSLAFRFVRTEKEGTPY